MKVDISHTPPPTHKELEDSTLNHPGLNEGQKVIWRNGIQYGSGEVVTVTKVKKSGSRWFIEINGWGSMFPARVMAFSGGEEAPSKIEMRFVEDVE